jgi:hypothetical protein
MAYTNLPITVTDTVDIDDWNFLKQFQLMLLERVWAQGNCFFPQCSKTWYSGTVPSNLTEAKFTDSSASSLWKGGTDDISGTVYADPWGAITAASVPNTAAQYPTIWWLIIDDNDPQKVIRSRIVSWKNTGELNFNQINDHVASLKIPSLASLYGKKYYIIGYSYAIWWSERLFAKPNSNEYFKGTVKSLTKDSDDNGISLPDSPAADKKSFRDKTANWQFNEHKGRELIAFGDDSHLHRIPILSNTKNTITYAALSGYQLSTDSDYIIVGAGLYGHPYNIPEDPYWWWRGYTQGYASHAADDTLGSMQMPSATVQVPSCIGTCTSGTCSLCDYIQKNTWDESLSVDYYSDFPVLDCDFSCGLQPDYLYGGKDYYKAIIRAVQYGLDILANGSSYIENKSYDGSTVIPYLNPARVFKLAGFNYADGTTGSVVGSTGPNDGYCNNQIALSGITAPYLPIQVEYSILQADGNYLYGKGVMTSNSLLTHSTFDTVFCQHYDDGAGTVLPGINGRAITVAWGFTRYVPKTFKYMFNQAGCFIPDVHTNIDGSKAAIDPPAPDGDFSTTHDCYGVGSWAKRNKSVNYIERKREIASHAGPEGFARETSGVAIATNDVARYVGDNYMDSSVQEGTEGFALYSLSDDPQQKYYDRMYVGQHASPLQHEFDSLKEGVITKGSNTWLQDKSKDWYDFGTVSGTAYQVTGTATSGTTTSVSCTDLAEPTPSTPSNPLHCYITNARFGGATPHIGFTLEVDFDDGNGNVVTEKRLITSSDETTPSWTVTVPFSQSTNGRPFRINEPYVLNRYVDRAIWIYKPDGTKLIGRVTGNDKDTMFFSDVGEPVQYGWTYKILDIEVGGVYKYDGTTWQKTTGADAVRTGVTVPHNWLTDPKANQEFIQKRYGKYIHGDIICSEIFNEIRLIYNVLTMLQFPAFWTARADDATPENTKEVETGHGNSSSSTLAAWESEAQSNASSLWGTSATEEGGRPYANVTTGVSDNSYGCVNWSINRRYSYLKVAGLCDRLPLATTFLAWAETPGSLPPAGCDDAVVFDAQGDGLVYQKWHQFASHSAATRTTDRAKLGSLTEPTGSFCGGSFPPARRKKTGYEVVNETVLVTPTFTYIG